MSREEDEALRARNQQGLMTIMMGFEQPQPPQAGSMHAPPTLRIMSMAGHEEQVQVPRSTGFNPLDSGYNPFRSGSASSTVSEPTRRAAFPHSGRAEDAASFPWWEVEDGATCDRQTQPQIGAAYHLRTRRKDGTVGLLIDPGARDNLIGSVTARQMCQELASKLQERQMDKSLPVEGVYKQAHVADISARISMNVIDAAGDATPASYTAPMIDQSMLPPLLGNRTLRRMQSLIDCGNGRLVIPGPGGMELRLSPGSKVYELELTDSGHWVLPVHPSPTDPSSRSRQSELQFNMSVRHDRSQSPPSRKPGGATSSSN